ncbi:MAG: sodium:solute symporter [Halodesulfurarchaeum sp.]
MSAALEIAIVVGYLVLALLVGLLAYRVTSRSAEEYYLAGRTLGTVVLLFTTFATLLSAFTFFGGPNIAYRSGPEWILVMGLMDGVIFGTLWYVIGYKQWLVGRSQGYVTLGEMLGDRFGSLGLRTMVAGISLFWLFPYVMLQQMGAGSALAALTEGALPYWAGAGLVTVFMIVYVILAGMRGVAWTDTLQGVFMLGMVWLAVAWFLAAVGGVGEATATLQARHPEFLALGGGTYTPQFVISQAVAIAFGVAMFPQVNQRFFVGKSVTVLKRSFVLWPLLVILLFVPAFLLGAWAKGMDITVSETGNVLPVLLQSYAPGWLAALIIAGALAAMMSSADSMLLSGASYFTRDLYRPLVDEAVSDRREDLLGRIGVGVFAAGAFVASLFRPGTLIDIGSTAFGGFAQLALPVAVALYWRGTTRTGMVVAVATSQVAYLASVFVPFVPTTLWGWDFALYGMGLGLFLVISVSLLTHPASDEDRAVYFEGLRVE